MNPFMRPCGPKPVNAENDYDRLYAKIGQLDVELDWLKKRVWDQPIEERHAWVVAGVEVGLSKQCPPAGIARAMLHNKKRRLEKKGGVSLI